MQRRRVRLVLSGSGTRYPVFIGALRVLERYGIEVVEVLGVSGGSLMAAGIAAGMDSYALEKLAKEALPGELTDIRWLPSWSAYHGRIKGAKLLARLRQLLPATFAEMKIPLHIVTFNMQRSRHVVWNGTQSIKDVPRLLRTSISLPFIYDMVMLDGEWHVDGGVGANFPLDHFGDGADVIGMRFRGHDERGPPRRLVTKMDAAEALIDGLIESTTREHIEDAVFARVMLLDTKASGFNLSMSAEDIDKMIAEGEASALEWVRAGGLS